MISPFLVINETFSCGFMIIDKWDNFFKLESFLKPIWVLPFAFNLVLKMEDNSRQQQGFFHF